MRVIFNINHCIGFYVNFALMVLPVINYGQKDTIDENLKLSGYIETYYNTAPLSYQKEIAPFIFNHGKTRTFALNLALIKASIAKKNYRASLALHSGTYVNANYDEALGSLRYINEAQIGIKIFSDVPIWLDMGIMPSHIGAESAIGQDNLTLTRSLMAELSPYYETGAKLTYDFSNNKGSAGIIVSNGWQMINKENSNDLALGALFNYKFNASWELNYNNFYGKAPSGLNGEMATRFYNNIFVKYNSNKLNLIVSYDIGRQFSDGRNSPGVQYWTTYSFIAKYKFLENTSLSYRIENFNDKNNAIPISGNIPALEHNILGNSINVDFTISEKAMLRIESRWLSATELLFRKNTDDSVNITTLSMCMKL